MWQSWNVFFILIINYCLLKNWNISSPKMFQTMLGCDKIYNNDAKQNLIVSMVMVMDYIIGSLCLINVFFVFFDFFWNSELLQGTWISWDFDISLCSKEVQKCLVVIELNFITFFIFRFLTVLLKVWWDLDVCLSLKYMKKMLCFYKPDNENSWAFYHPNIAWNHF